MQDVKAACFFEVSWEVCNKVGGIYTVLSSKAAQMMSYYPAFFFIGPYVAKKAAVEFQHLSVPANLQTVFDGLHAEGIDCYYGKWQVKGKPTAVLIDFSSFMQHKDGIKAYLWERFQIDSLAVGSDFDEPVVWGWAVGKFLEKAVQALGSPKAVVQCHEWLSGAALLYIKDKKVPMATVFTTHATILGRTIAGAERPLYEILEQLQPEQEAKNYGIQAKHGMERASAQHADVMTTVSEVTGLEAKHLLGREADVLLPNGLDFEQFPDLEEIPAKHAEYKARIKEFLLPYFFPYYSFDMDNTLFFYLSGRYEFRNKGIDVFIAALGQLNERLKKEKSECTIVVFIFVPAEVRVPKLSIMESKSVFEDMQDEVGHYLTTIGQRVIATVAQGKLPAGAELFDEDFLFDMKKFIVSFKKEGSPSVVTHELADPSDAVTRHLAEQGLRNAAEDKVKVIFYPSYLSSSDGLLDMEYYPAIWGCHLGVFPSYYEPWGYTPLESAAYGVPSITTDLAGFGLYVKKNLVEKKEPGIIVVERRGKKDADVVRQLTERMHWYAILSKAQRIQNKIVAEHFSRKLDWKHLVAHYIEAHNHAVEQVFGK